MIFSFKTLVSDIYRLEHERHRKQSRGSLSSLSLNLNNHGHSSKLPHSNDNLYESSLKDNEAGYVGFENSSGLENQRSHDGVFLRPVAIAR